MFASEEDLLPIKHRVHSPCTAGTSWWLRTKKIVSNPVQRCDIVAEALYII